LQFLIFERSIKKYIRVYKIRHLKFGLDKVLSFGIDLHASVLSEWFWVCFCSHALVIKRPCATINYPVYIPLYHYSIYTIYHIIVPYHPSRWWSPLCVCDSLHCFVAGWHSTVIATYLQWENDVKTAPNHLLKVGASCRRLEHR